MERDRHPQRRYTEGHDTGYADGYAQGKTDGYADGYAQGKIDGHEAGYQEGHDDGYQAGYDDGVAAGSGGDQEPQPSPDGDTHIVIDVGPIDRDFELLFAATGSDLIQGNVAVHWGDPTGEVALETIPEGVTKDLTLTHTYQRAGTYDVTISVRDATIVLGHGGTNSGLVGQSTSLSTSIPASVQSITIGDGVDGIDKYGLAHLRGLKSLYIPDGVTLGTYSMFMCFSLDSVRLPADMTEIPASCFQDCTSLRSITIPQSVTSIGSSAFKGCSALSAIDIPDTVTSIGSSAFYDCATLQSFVFKSQITELPSSCFRGCKSLRSIELSPNTQTIRGYALYGLSALESLDVPATVTAISDYAVYNAYGLRWMRMRPTTPPTTSQYTFSSIPPGLKFIVPDGCGESYRTATRWKTYAARIFEEWEVQWQND